MKTTLGFVLVLVGVSVSNAAYAQTVARVCFLHTNNGNDFSGSGTGDSKEDADTDAKAEAYFNCNKTDNSCATAAVLCKNAYVAPVYEAPPAPPAEPQVWQECKVFNPKTGREYKGNGNDYGSARDAAVTNCKITDPDCSQSFSFCHAEGPGAPTPAYQCGIFTPNGHDFRGRGVDLNEAQARAMYEGRKTDSTYGQAQFFCTQIGPDAPAPTKTCFTRTASGKPFDGCGADQESALKEARWKCIHQDTAANCNNANFLGCRDYGDNIGYSTINQDVNPPAVAYQAPVNQPVTTGRITQQQVYTGALKAAAGWLNHRQQSSQQGNAPAAR